jgi:4-hydroxy-2-oxoheptanedioate aldolase
MILVDLRPSKVLKKLRNGEVASCIKLNLDTSRTVEIAAINGFDCVWTDVEHVANSISAIEKQILAAKAYNMDILVRVSRGGYSDYIRSLEADATAIMVPHIMSLQDAKNVAKMTRFYPVGLRPVDGGNADGGYCNVDFKSYIEQANRERMVVVQIEDKEPLDELEEIASVEGIDMLFFGPGDFSQSIGTPGDFSNPLIDQTRRRIAKVALEHGKFAGTVGSLSNLEELIDMGYRFISIGADVVAFSQYCSDIVGKFKNISVK